MLTCDEYVTATTLDAAFAAMAAGEGRFRLVAGATDLLPWARQGRAGDVHVPVLIDVAGIPELRQRRIGDGTVTVGAATPFQRFLDDKMLSDAMPCMRRCATWFADDQIRECATIGGNLMNASPAADGTPPLIALNASVELASCRGRRMLALQDFITGPGRTRAACDEILVAIRCDALPGHGGAFEKVGHRRSLVISVAAVAALVRLTPDRLRFEDVRLAVGGVAPRPLRLGDIEDFLRGAPLGAAAIQAASEMRLDLIQSRTRQAYRRSVLRGFIARALIEASSDAGGDVGAISAELEAIDA